MPNTAAGLPYPAPTDAPNVPLHIQQLAEALDPLLPRVVRRTTSQTVTNSTTVVNDDTLKITLTPGLWRVQGVFRVTGPAAADVKLGWLTTGSLGGLARDLFGPPPTTTDLAATTVRMNFLSFGAVVAYGLDGTNGASIFEDMLFNVTVTGTLQLQWAQNTANATGTVMNTGSRLIASQLVAA